MNPTSQPGSALRQGPGQARFDKSRRLRRRGEFQHVFDGGQRVRGRFFTVLLSQRRAPRAVEGSGPSQKAARRASSTLEGHGDGTRLGIVASKKLGNAVRRNRAKRLIREIFRKNVPPSTLGGVDLVVIPRTELFDATFASLQEDFHAVLARIARTASGSRHQDRPGRAHHARS